MPPFLPPPSRKPPKKNMFLIDRSDKPNHTREHYGYHEVKDVVVVDVGHLVGDDSLQLLLGHHGEKAADVTAIDACFLFLPGREGVGVRIVYYVDIWLRYLRRAAPAPPLCRRGSGTASGSAFWALDISSISAAAREVGECRVERDEHDAHAYPSGVRCLRPEQAPRYRLPTAKSPKNSASSTMDLSLFLAISSKKLAILGAPVQLLPPSLALPLPLVCGAHRARQASSLRPLKSTFTGSLCPGGAAKKSPA